MDSQPNSKNIRTCKHNAQSDWELQNDKQGVGGEEWNEEGQREKPTGCSLTFSGAGAAVAVIFTSAGNKVTLASVRTGDRRSGWLRRWRRPLLTRAGVSRGDRSGGLLTGGPLTPRGTCPGTCSVSTSFYRKLEGKSRQGKKSSSSFLCLTSVTLDCYSY